MNRTIRLALLFVAILLPLATSSATESGPNLRLVSILKKGPVGVEQFNRWRRLNPIEEVNLRGADLRGANLRGADLRLADLSNAQLDGAVFGLNYADEHRKLKECVRCQAMHDKFISLDKRVLAECNKKYEKGIFGFKCGTGPGLALKLSRSAAHLHGANLAGADMDGADFSGAKGCDEVLNAPPDFLARCENPKVRASVPSTPDGVDNLMDRRAFKRFCDESTYGCFSIRTPDGCDGCDRTAIHRLRSELHVRVKSGEPGLGGHHKPGCVGFRRDIGGTREMAELVRSVLGTGYYIGKCTTDGFPINVHVIQ